MIPSGPYNTILADPPWEQSLMGRRNRPRDPHNKQCLPYPTMSVDEIKAMSVFRHAETACHLWLWTTNQFLRAGFEVMEAWGFNYLAPIHWIKPSGCGNYFIHRSQTLLFGYRNRCEFALDRYKPNLIYSPAKRHSEKPIESYELIESISKPPRLELFARSRRHGWDVWGNEVPTSLTMNRHPAEDKK